MLMIFIHNYLKLFTHDKKNIPLEKLRRFHFGPKIVRLVVSEMETIEESGGRAPSGSVMQLTDQSDIRSTLTRELRILQNFTEVQIVLVFHREYALERRSVCDKYQLRVSPFFSVPIDKESICIIILDFDKSFGDPLDVVGVISALGSTCRNEGFSKALIISR